MKDCSKCPDKDWCSGEEMDDFTCPVLNNNYNYQSPIELIMGEIQTQIENDSVKAVQNYGFNINKAELEKALKYDRDQYDLGYSDARNRYERPQGEWIFKHNSSDVWCSNCDISLESNLCEGIKFSYCPNCGADMRGTNKGGKYE